MKKYVFVLLTAVLALFIVACGGGGAEEPETAAGASIDVVMNDIYYGDVSDNVNNPPVWNVTAGEIVTINSNNLGTLDHNWAIIEAGTALPDTIADPAEIEDSILFDIGVVAGGDTSSNAMTAPAAGEYVVICTVAGHYPAMQGRLVVGE